jgi:CPA2 family monovalent cation:H+ antiporter-2
LVIIPILVSDTQQGLSIPLAWALIKATLVFALIMAVGHWALRPLFHEIARARSAELFTLTVLMVSLAAAWLTHEAGLSLQSALIPGEAGQMLFASIIISMVIAPFLIRYNGKLAEIFCHLRASDQDHTVTQDLAHEAEGLEQHVIICGYGRIGQNLGRLLDHEGFPYLALDLDPSVVREAHEAGEPVHYGNATRHEIMHAAGIERAGVVVISFENHTTALQILHHIRKVKPQLPVLVRTKDDTHLEELEAAGAAEVMPEAVEASLMMGGQLLLLLKVPGSRILKIMREIRENHYKLLRDFYHGEEAIDLEHEEGFQERLHTVTLPERAFAVGHSIEDLHLWDWDVSVTAVHRGGIRGEAPTPETRLQAGDVLVLAGTAHHLEHAEGLLLYGL